MNSYPKLVKKRLDRCILELANSKVDYVKRPGKDFSRKRLFTFEYLIEFLIVMGAGSQTKEIYAKMVLYNFCEMITLNVVIKHDNNRKHTYQVNFTSAITICRIFYLCCKDKHPPDVEALICKYISL